VTLLYNLKTNKLACLKNVEKQEIVFVRSACCARMYQPCNVSIGSNVCSTKIDELENRQARCQSRVNSSQRTKKFILHEKAVFWNEKFIHRKKNTATSPI